MDMQNIRSASGISEIQLQDYVDAHFHVDQWKNAQEIVRQIEAKQVYTIAVTNSPSAYSKTLHLTRNTKYLRPAIGLHPVLAGQKPSELDRLLEGLKQTRYVGEIGLDYGHSVEEEKLQRKTFESIVNACADEKNKILSVHSCNAAEDVISMLGSNFPGKVILHWYSGSLQDLHRGVKYGFYFSINNDMTVYQDGVRLISEIPDDRLLTESDGPFINVNGVPASPLNIYSIVKIIAGLRSVDPEEMRENINVNFHSIDN